MREDDIDEVRGLLGVAGMMARVDPWLPPVDVSLLHCPGCDRRISDCMTDPVWLTVPGGAHHRMPDTGCRTATLFCEVGQDDLTTLIFIAQRETARG